MRFNEIFKAYDIRGTVPDQLDEESARRIGAAFARFAASDRIAVGRDCRESSPLLATALIDGITSQGVGVDDLGMITTDMVYYAAGAMNQPGAMITASHNPKGYNGIKLCLAGAAPVGVDTGLVEIQAWAEEGLEPVSEVGGVAQVDVLTGYLDHLLSIVMGLPVSPFPVCLPGYPPSSPVSISSRTGRSPTTIRIRSDRKTWWT